MASIFTIKLDESCAGQSTSLDEFKKMFSIKCLKSVQRFLPLRNPDVKSLYGTAAVPTYAWQQKCYMDSLLGDTTNFQVSSNCCMQELENGEEALLTHIFDEVSRHSVTMHNKSKDSLNTVRKRAQSLKKAFEKRQSLRNIPSLVGRKSAFAIAMKFERVTHSSSSCRCNLCALTYDQPSVETGIFYCLGIEENQDDYVLTTANFAMSQLCFSNMLSDLDSMYAGVSYPKLYLGGVHSFIPLHIEDLSLWSFNFLLHGYPKLWMIIPPTSVSRLTDALQMRGELGYVSWCRNILNHKFFLPTLQFLKEENIPFELVIQYAGEGIVLLPNCAHAGWNLGTNLSEACNFGTNKWIPYGCVSLQCNCKPDSVHADLSDVIAVHQPSLLNAYRNRNGIVEIKDQYFQKSTIIRRMDLIVEPSVTQEKSAACVSFEPVSAPDPDAMLGTLPVLQANKSRVKCPVCNVSWASVQKFNMKTHLKKYHRPRINEEAVRKFTEQYSISLN
ncbi:uncharacterized protein LOC117647170 isoform X2 [Thrips palmi]|uniref:Uncharacterized protein LOC117647170 isoform X2 n=1 Tax=Thrips palmi TaxID=161013 RepID=A0A6P8Z3K3_THRPL|nr:uncharacterized protein LOC117647170 isoform X2 [Thrips palmi]